MISMAEQSPAGGVSPPETSGSALARAATAATTPTVSNKTTSSPIEISVGCQLYGFLSMCIYRFLPGVLSKSPFQLKRKTSQGLGSEAAKCKHGRPYIYLNEICESHGLPKSGSKPDVIKRLVQHYFNDPECVPDYVIDRFLEHRIFFKTFFPFPIGKVLNYIIGDTFRIKNSA